MTDPGARVPNPLDVEPAGTCAICAEEQIRTVELRTATTGGIRIEVTHYLECGCGRRLSENVK